jgi:hypothetical protein
LSTRPLAQQPAFLTTDTTYLYGAWPHVLLLGSDDSASDSSGPTKICIDQRAWLPATADTTTTTTTTPPTYPFADGTNPSIVSVARLRALPHPHATLQAFLDALPSTVVWLVSACLTNSQCTWQDSPDDLRHFQFSSSSSKPDTLRTMLLLMDASFGVVQQTTIGMVVDAPWGRRPKRLPNRAAKEQPPRLLALDDARLFVHDNGQLWISYREGPSFGYESQVLNPLHLAWTDGGSSAGPTTTVTATVQSSETTYFCCGRNMALMQDRRSSSSSSEPSPQLLSLTWVDPITVQVVNTTAQPVPNGKRQAQDLTHGRRLAAPTKANHHKPAKSHIHGTNAFMVYLPAVDEFLGVAHFHRPNDRATNPYARFGHHYTHAFFTVAAVPPYVLTAISAEFVYPRGDGGGGGDVVEDAEIIQFSSGLEVTEDGQTIVLAYGINDCEAAVTTVPWATVADLLRPVAAGQQVVDLMQPLVMS